MGVMRLMGVMGPVMRLIRPMHHMRHTLLRLIITTIAVTLSLAVSRSASTTAVASPEIPGATQTRTIALVGGTIHPVSGPAMEGGTLLFAEGRIVAVGRDIEIPENADRIDISGRHVYPALFDADSNIGLTEISAVRATRDEAETGRINPNVRAQVAFNPDSELIPVTRSNGVLLSLTAPGGGLISGRSAVMMLDGWTWEDMALRGDVGMHVEWPRMTPLVDWESQPPAERQSQGRDQALDQLRRAFTDARAYHQARRAAPERHDPDVRWEAMRRVLEGEMPLIVSADEIQQIQSAVAFAQQEKVKLIILGGYDAPLCAELLKANEVPVIVGGTYRLPMRRDDPYDAPFTVPERLRAAGIPYCIAGAGRFGASNARNLPYHAAMAAAFGLPADEALKAITLYPAQILGVADRVGSLEEGKDATLIITDGDPLETPTQVLDAYVEGRRVDLSDRHKRLWKKYEEKYRRQREAR